MSSPAFTALTDQIQAAAREADALVHAMAALGGDSVSVVPPTPWLMEQHAALTAAVNDGTVKICTHLTGSPTVAHAAVWKRWVITCGPCSSHHLRPGPLEDSTCDRCRRYGLPLHGCTVTLGPLVLAYGLCPGCMTEVHPTTRTPRRTA